MTAKATPSSDKVKKAIGKQAAELVRSGMVVGLGTGSTAHYFIDSLIERCQQGLKISAIATSKDSMQRAQAGGIPIIAADVFTSLDLTIDGADEVDPQKRLIKGGGGALLREKIVASSSKEMVVIIDEFKLVKRLGKRAIPVEIVPFGYRSTLSKLSDQGYTGSMRLNQNGTLFITDNGNYILDLHLIPSQFYPEIDDNRIKEVTGVVETGIFINQAGRVIVGYSDGRVECYQELPPSLPYLSE